MENNVYAEIPVIMTETSSGIQTMRIIDEMFAHREINCIGEIDSALVNSLCLQLRYLAKQDPEAEITMYINSPGGQVSSGLALFDTMAAIPCPVHTICTGMAASMASLLFVSGSQRDMLPHSQVMIHDPLIAGGIGGSALSIKAESDKIMRTREITAQALVKHTGHTLEEVYEATSYNHYFEAKEAVEWGLADRIIEHL